MYRRRRREKDREKLNTFRPFISLSPKTEKNEKKKRKKKSECE
jgi:hypothetical protein